MDKAIPEPVKLSREIRMSDECTSLLRSKYPIDSLENWYYTGIPPKQEISMKGGCVKETLETLADLTCIDKTDDLWFSPNTLRAFKGRPECFSPLSQQNPSSDRANCSSVHVTATPHRISLHVAHTCNLNCSYCYANGGNYQLHESKMTAKTAIESLAKWFSKTEAFEPDEYEILFFGGEPFLAIETMIKAAEYARQRKGDRVRFSLCTNGTLVNERILFFMREFQPSIMVSIDGPKASHDRYRITKDNSSSFEHLERNLPLLMEHASHAIARSTITRDNSDLDVIYEEVQRFGFSDWFFKPAIPINSTAASIAPDRAKLSDSVNSCYTRMFEEMLTGKKTMSRHLSDVAYRILFRIKKTKYCELGRFPSVLPNGMISPCHRFVADDTLQAKLEDWNPVRHFLQAPMRDKRCLHCWVQYLCGGGCFADRQLDDSDPEEVDGLCWFRKATALLIVKRLSSLDTGKLDELGTRLIENVMKVNP